MRRFLSSAIVPTTPSERSQTRDICFFIIIARRRETEEHPPSSFSLSKRDRYKNEKKRKEVCELRKKREVYVFRDRSADAVGTISVNERKALFSSSSLDFENAPSFHAALPREKRKTRHTKRKEKTRTPKNTPPFLKMSQHVATKKVEKLFFCSPSFYAKTGDGSLADVLVRGSSSRT